MIRRASCFLLVMMLLLAAPLTAAADSGVTYEGGEEAFVIQPGSSYSETDLFPEFKDVMPGDTLTQKVVVTNSSNVAVDVYMRALGTDANSRKLLSKLNLTVEQADGPTHFDTTADQTGGLTDWVLLGTVPSKGKVELNVTLNVPITLDNEFQETAGKVIWAFRVEEKGGGESIPQEVMPPIEVGFVCNQVGDCFD